MTDLTTCDREPIHRLGCIQSTGTLLAFDRRWKLCFYADAIGLLESVQLAVGMSLDQIGNDRFTHKVRGGVQTSSTSGLPHRVLGADFDWKVAVDMSVVVRGDHYLVEMEPAQQRLESISDQLLPLMSFLKAADSLDTVLAGGVRFFRDLTGYHRVMVYQFSPDGSGTVVAEAKTIQGDSFLGLRYPATDIPKQARALYKKQLLRIINDVNDLGVAIQPQETRGDGHALDLSYSMLRAVSPIHLEYLKNMGVAASLSISLMVDGELWGLIACHHNQPKQVDYALRTQLELLAEIYALDISNRQQQRLSQARQQKQPLIQRFQQSLADAAEVATGVMDGAAYLSELIEHSGVAVFLDGEIKSIGNTPTEPQLQRLIDWLSESNLASGFTTHCIREHIQDWDNPTICGVAAIRLSSNAQDFFMVFRASVVQQTKWAGNPEKPVNLGPNGDRLLPRSSFAEWQQTHTDQSKPWSDFDNDALDSIRIAMLDTLVSKIGDRERIRREAQSRQKVLISELNHRVRNMLGLINSLARQTGKEAESVDQFVDNFTGRVFALATAHNQLTATHYQGIELRTLIDNELKGYVDDSSELNLGQVPVSILPEATTQLVLVLHELFTNSMKYGALAHKTPLSINWQKQKKDLLIEWVEHGNRVAKPVAQQGFGMTLITHLLPHELDADVSIEYDQEDYKISIRIPRRYLHWRDHERHEHQEKLFVSDTQASLNHQTRDKIFILEDNLLISIDLEEKLRALGYQHIEAFAQTEPLINNLAEQKPDFAILDVDLGDENSAPVADELVKLGVPFLFATGYESSPVLMDQLYKAPVLIKPYSLTELGQAILKLRS